MPHVELSLSEPNLLRPPGTGERLGSPLAGFGTDDPIEAWSAAVARAQEPCLLLDRAGVVVAVSPACGRLLGVDLRGALGHRLVDAVQLLDFNAVAGELPDWEVDKIPPLLALSTGGLARGLLRVPGEDGAPTTADAISTPLRDDLHVVGSLTFFAPLSR